MRGRRHLRHRGHDLVQGDVRHVGDGDGHAAHTVHAGHGDEARDLRERQSGHGAGVLLHGAAGDTDTDGIAIAANALELNGGTINLPSGGTAAELDHAQVAASASHTVDGVRPTVSGAAVSGTTLAVTFNETLGAAANLANGSFR